MDGIERLRAVPVVQHVVAQHLRPAQDGVERRPQFVREHGQEFVLHADAIGELVVQDLQLVFNRAPAVDFGRERQHHDGRHAEIGLQQEQRLGGRPLAERAISVQRADRQRLRLQRNLRLIFRLIWLRLCCGRMKPD